MSPIAATSRITRALARIACLVVLGVALVGIGACEVGVGYNGGYDADYPPDAYIATTEPVYVDGRAAYWYGGRWYYRDGGGWRHYDREPPALYQRRMQGPVVRRNFEAPASRGRGRATGGWRGGRH